MSKAPKKIWLHEGFWRSGDSDYWTDEEDTDPKYRVGDHYIRADLVDGLVEALEECVKQNVGYFVRDMAEAALAALKEEG